MLFTGWYLIHIYQFQLMIQHSQWRWLKSALVDNWHCTHILTYICTIIAITFKMWLDSNTSLSNHILTLNMCIYIVMCNCQLSHIIPSTIKLGNNTSSVGPFQWHHSYHHWLYSQYIGGRYLVSLAQGTFRLTLKVQTLNRTVSPRVTTCHHNHVARQKIQTASTCSVDRGFQKSHQTSFVFKTLLTLWI